MKNTMSNPLLIFTVVTEFVCVCEKTTNEKKKISCKYTNQNFKSYSQILYGIAFHFYILKNPTKKEN